MLSVLLFRAAGIRRFWLTIVCLSIGACADTECVSGVGAPGVLLTVRDSLTDAGLDSVSTVTVVRLTNRLAPGQPDSARGPLVSGSNAPRGPLSITDDHPARYRILVEVPLYAAWEANVEVERSCPSVRTVSLVARMKAAS